MMIMPFLIAMTIPAAAPDMSAAERAIILDTARVPVAKRLGRPVRFRVDRLDLRDGWVFVLAQMCDRNGRPISYAGTPLAGAEAAGAVSKVYAALLRRDGARWRLVDYAIGPTDVAWAGWASEHHAPPALFD